jgi:hypothetical protein
MVMAGRALDRRPFDGAGGVLRLVILMVFAADLAVSAWVGWRSAVLEPYSDMFDWVARWWAYRADGDAWRYLIAPANFHRPALIMSILYADLRFFGARNLMFVLAGSTALLAAATLLGRTAARSAPAGHGLAVGVLGAMLTLMAGNILDAVIPININYSLGLAIGLLAILVAEPRPGEPTSPWRVAGGLILFALATLGDAVAVAVWPAMVFGAWQGRRGAAAFLAILAGGAVVVALYAWGQTPPAGPPAQAAASLRLGLNVLGLPWTRVAGSLGWAVGLVFLMASGWALAWTSRQGPEARGARIASQMILFSLGAAALAALGRTGSGAEAPLRYAVLMAPMQVGLLILAARWIGGAAGRPQRALDATLVLIAVLLLGQQLAMARAAIATTDVTRGLLAQFKAGGRSPAMAERLHPDLEHAAEIQRRMDREGVYQWELHKPR